MSPGVFAATITWVVGLLLVALTGWASHYAERWYAKHWDELRRRLGG